MYFALNMPLTVVSISIGIDRWNWYFPILGKI